MPEYFSYYASVGRHPALKHEVSQGKIDTYTKSSIFFSSFRKWNFDGSFPVTEIVEEQVNSDGNGWISVKNDSNHEYTFFIYKYAAEFILEVKEKCF